MQKIKTVILPMCLVLVGAFCFIGCTKNDSKFYKDGEDDGLAIFSNTDNNVMSCYINGEAWRTVPRITTYFLNSFTDYEVYLSRNQVSNTLETVQINWQGYYQKDRNKSGNIRLHLAIPRNSFRRYFNALQGRQMAIDSSVGNYFTAFTGQAALDNRKLNGSVYFHTMQLDSIASGSYSGKMSGIFEASFGTGTITKGRFDHVLIQAQIQ